MARRCLRFAVVALFCLSATGCGFHLRGTQSESLRIETIAIESPARFRELRDLIEAELAANGTGIVDTSPDAVLLELIDERVQSRPVTSSGAGTASQFEIQLEVDFSISRDERLLLPVSTLSTRRIYSFDRGSLVANSSEQRLQTSEMRRELAGRMIQRINATSGEAL